MRSLVSIALLGLGVVACSGDTATTTTPDIAPPTTVVITTSTALSTTTTTAATTTTTTTTTAPPTTTAAIDEVMALEDFEIELIILQDQCFGSAGASIEVEPRLFVRGMRWGLARESGIPPDDFNATLIYDVHGGEHGTDRFSISLEGDDYFVTKSYLSTADCDDELTVELVDLIER